MIRERKGLILGVALIVLLVALNSAPAGLGSVDEPATATDPGDDVPDADGPSEQDRQSDGEEGEPTDGGDRTGDGGEQASAGGTDSDGDGLSDSAERAATGPLAAADPERYDIFVEIDYRGTDDPEAIKEELKPVVERFEEAPIDNPDGSTGIDLHLVTDDEISHSGRISEDDLFRLEGGAVVKQYRDYRGSGYHYAAIDLTGSGDRGGNGAFGRMVVTLDSANKLDHAFMHELGHSLGIIPSTYRGVDSRAVPASEYQSVMNYNYRNAPPRYNDGDPFDDWAFVEDGYTPGRGGGECESTEFSPIC